MQDFGSKITWIKCRLEITFYETERHWWHHSPQQQWFSPLHCPQTSSSAIWMLGWLCFLLYTSTCPAAVTDSVLLSCIRWQMVTLKIVPIFFEKQKWPNMQKVRLWETGDKWDERVSYLLCSIDFNWFDQTLTAAHRSWLSNGQKTEHSHSNMNKIHHGSPHLLSQRS